MTVAEILKYISQNYQVIVFSKLFDERSTGIFLFSWKFSLFI